jgi:hypothetical protein
MFLLNQRDSHKQRYLLEHIFLKKLHKQYNSGKDGSKIKLLQIKYMIQQDKNNPNKDKVNNRKSKSKNNKFKHDTKTFINFILNVKIIIIINNK